MNQEELKQKYGQQNIQRAPSSTSSGFARSQGGTNKSIPIDNLGADYLKGSYFENGQIKAELLTCESAHIAKILKDSGIKSTQIRNIFRQIRAIERTLDVQSWDEAKTQVQRLMPLAAYFVGRGQSEFERKGRENFKSFIDQNVKLALQSNDSFKKGFVPHFESVVAYLRYYSPRG